MKKIVLCFWLLIFSFKVGLADSPLKEKEYSWMGSIRSEHPRMFLTKEDIPQIRKTAFSFESQTYEKTKKRADVLLGKPIVFEDPFAATGESNSNRNYGYYVADAAIMYLITQDSKYLELTKDILRELISYYQLRVENNLNIEWYAFSQICAMCAYDWIYNDLSPNERELLGKPLFEVMCKIAWHGEGIRKVRFRENKGGYKTGMYGVSVLPWYIGLTFWKEGYDDKFCEKMIRNGYDMHQKMIDFRSKMLGKNGGGASGVPGYSLGAYPFAEYDFIYTFRSSTGIDIADKMKYMIGYLNYMDWIRLPDNLEYGFGDCHHYDCKLPHIFMNGHVWEIANLFGNQYPEILPVASRLLTMFKDRKNMDMIPFIRLLHKVDPLTDVDENTPKPVQPKAMYFETMGQIYMRSGTGDNDTYALFVSGGVPKDHKHYDNNNFIIYKQGYRALDSGTRPQPGWHLPYYYARTVAHNCVTITMPSERLPEYWGGPAANEEKGLEVPNDGGQCNVLGSKLLAMEETDDYVYLASDASACYHEDKSDLVMREFVWCVPDVFIVFDRIISDQPEYAKKWLYHTAAEPLVKGREFSEESQGGKSICRTLFPNEVRLEKIGGPGKQFWSDGRNWSIPKFTPEDYGYAQRATIPPDDHPLVGQWRMEVSPVGNRKEDIFMHIIQVGDKNLSTLPITSTFDSDSTIGVEFDYNNKHYHIAFDKKAVSNYGCNITVTTK